MGLDAVRWITHDVGRLFPQEWARFRDGVAAGEHGILLRDAGKLAGIPGVVSSPLDIAWELSRHGRAASS